MQNNSIENSNPVNEEAIKSMNTENAIYFNFSYSALKLLGKNLYSNAANAISELVANALDAKAPEVFELRVLFYSSMAFSSPATLQRPLRRQRARWSST